MDIQVPGNFLVVARGRKSYKGGRVCAPVTANNVQADDESGKGDGGVPAETAERLRSCGQ